jgi:hypothetical protein
VEMPQLSEAISLSLMERMARPCGSSIMVCFIKHIRPTHRKALNTVVVFGMFLRLAAP